MNKALFASQNAPSLYMRLECGEIQFHNGALTLNLDDEEDKKKYDELTSLIKKRPDLSARIRELNMAEAEKVALAHKEKMQQAAVSGTTTSEDVKHAAAMAQLAERDAQMQAHNVPPEQREAFNKQIAEAGLALTEETSDVVRNSEGFIPEPKAQPVDLEQELPEQPVSSEQDVAKDEEVGSKVGKGTSIKSLTKNAK